KAIHSTAKGMKAVDNSLSAYQYGKSLDVLRKTEYGIYGLASANGFGEYITGKDMFGNELSEEKRNQSLTESLFILGVSGMGMYADRLIDKNAVYGGTTTISVKIDLALKPEWKNTRIHEVKIKIPDGEILNVGKVVPQTIDKTGTVLSGGGDQILMPRDWPSEWIQDIYKVPIK